MSIRTAARCVPRPLLRPWRPSVPALAATGPRHRAVHRSPPRRQAIVAGDAEVARVQLPERKLRMTFTCTAPACTTPGVRSTHEFSRQAYETGIVLVQCPGCKTRHLVADHLGWFDADDLTQGGRHRTIEDILRAKGEAVTYGQSDGTLDGEGDISFVAQDPRTSRP